MSIGAPDAGAAGKMMLAVTWLGGGASSGGGTALYMAMVTMTFLQRTMPRSEIDEMSSCFVRMGLCEGIPSPISDDRLDQGKIRCDETRQQQGLPILADVAPYVCIPSPHFDVLHRVPPDTV